MLFDVFVRHPVTSYHSAVESEKASDLRVLREVFRGFSEEARTRGIPSPSFGGFGFICCGFFIRLAAGKNLIVNTFELFQATENVCSWPFSAVPPEYSSALILLALFWLSR